MIIAIDGPAASGKGTLGRRLAAHFGLRQLDTGLGAKLGEVVEPGVGPGADETDTDCLGGHGATW